jgi:ABC-type nitrate/sulfonate/bicarbonate transport system substrate-binding protein
MNYQRTSLKQFLYVFLPFFFLVSSAEAAELKRITFGYSTLGAMATGAWVAKETGAFEKHGIQADLIYIASGPVVVQALLGGDLQGGIAGTNAIIAAILRSWAEHPSSASRGLQTNLITGSGCNRKSIVSRT